MRTVKNGRRTTARLDRKALEKASDPHSFPVTTTEEEVPTNEPNGTTVLISKVHLKRLIREDIIRYIEQRMARERPDATVYVDSHKCEFQTPEAVEEYTFDTSGPERDVLGDTQMVIRVSKAPLDGDSRGIQVYSHKNWLATTLCGAEGKDMCEYIFGEVDVPAIEEYNGPIAPFDLTRSGSLNPNNEVIACLFKFIGPKIDKARRKLVARQKERARTREAKELAVQARKISELLSEHFRGFQVQLRKARTAAAGPDPGRKRFAPIGTEDGDEGWIEGGDDLARRLESEEVSPNNKKNTGRRGPDLPTPVIADSEGDTTGHSCPN